MKAQKFMKAVLMSKMDRQGSYQKIQLYRPPFSTLRCLCVKQKKSLRPRQIHPETSECSNILSNYVPNLTSMDSEMHLASNYFFVIYNLASLSHFRSPCSRNVRDISSVKTNDLPIDVPQHFRHCL